MKLFFRRFGLLILSVAFAGWWYFRYKVVHPLPWPDIQVESAPGVEHSLDELVLFPSAIHFFASWCGPCMKELPELSKYQQAHPDERIYLITDDSWDKITPLADRLNLEILRVERMSDFGVRSIPTTFFFDRNGNQVMAFQGMGSWDDPEFRSKIAPIFNP